MTKREAAEWFVKNNGRTNPKAICQDKFSDDQCPFYFECDPFATGGIGVSDHCVKFCQKWIEDHQGIITENTIQVISDLIRQHQFCERDLISVATAAAELADCGFNAGNFLREKIRANKVSKITEQIKGVLNRNGMLLIMNPDGTFEIKDGPA